MATNNSSNQAYKNNADGWEMAGGQTKRKLTVNNGDITLQGGNSNTYTFPSSGGTLALEDNTSVNNQTGTSYTFVMSDKNAIVTANNSSAQTYTVPTNSSVAFPVGTKLIVTQLGTGAVTVSGDTGVTVNGASGGSVTSNQYQMIVLHKIGTDAWQAEIRSASQMAIDTDGTLAANSDDKVASQKATKTYVDTKDGQNVKLTGTQTVAGDKTFTGATKVQNTMLVDGGLGGAFFTGYLGGFLQLTKASGDSKPALQLYAGDSSIQLGPGGSTSPDITIKRTGVKQLDFGSAKLQSVADPVNNQDVATKKYVDDNAESRDISKQNLLQSVIPKMWRKVYRVNPNTLTGAQAGTSVYTTITAAIAAAKSDFNGFGNGYDTGPEFRRLILVDSGTYNEQITSVPYFVDIVGSSGNAADVTINYSGAGATMELGGGTHYIANLTLIQSGTSSGGGIYPLHSDSPPGAPGSNVNAPQSKVFANVIFTSQNANRGEAAGIGMPGRAAYLFVDCVFNPYAGNSGINVHNTANQKWPAQITFVDCEVYTTGALAMHVSDLGSTQNDRIAWVGGIMDVSSGTSQTGWITQTAGHTLQMNLDPAVITKPIYNNSSYPTTVSFAKLPIGPDLLGALSRDSQTYYYPSAIKQVLSFFTPYSADAYSSLTANRIYYVPVPINVAVNSYKMNFLCQVAAGNIAAGIYADDGTGKPAGYLSTKTPTALTSGLNTLTGNYLRTLYPGIRQIWLGVVVTDNTATIATSEFLSSYQQCYYQDLSSGFSSMPITAVPIAITAGTVVPVGSILTQ